MRGHSPPTILRLHLFRKTHRQSIHCGVYHCLSYEERADDPEQHPRHFHRPPKHNANRFLGTGFVTFHLPPPLMTLSLGICMDLNVQPPAEWVGLDTGPYEIAEYCVAQRTRVLVLLNAWLDSKEAPEEEKDWRTINYWALRMRPLWAKVVAEGWPDSEDEDRHSDGSDGAGEEQGRQDGEELLVVICNRTGTENGAFPHSLMSSQTQTDRTCRGHVRGLVLSVQHVAQ